MIPDHLFAHIQQVAEVFFGYFVKILGLGGNRSALLQHLAAKFSQQIMYGFSVVCDIHFLIYNISAESMIRLR